MGKCECEICRIEDAVPALASLYIAAWEQEMREDDVDAGYSGLATLHMAQTMRERMALEHLNEIEHPDA